MEKQPTDEQLMSAVGDVLTDTNRCIYEWTQLNKKGPNFKIDYKEIRGLVNNWITRHFKPLIGYSETQWLFRAGTPIVELDSKTGYISKVILCSPGGYSRSSDERVRAKIAALFTKVDCREFFYNPAKKAIDDLFWNPLFKTSTATAGQFKTEPFTSNVPVELQSLNNFKF